MRNIWNVSIKRPNGSASHMTAMGEGMTAEQAKAHVIGKQTKRVREAIAEGDFTIEVIGDVNNVL
ncbi:MAG: hypothetical protein ABS894_00790 [Aerococcus urinaeequi]